MRSPTAPRRNAARAGREGPPARSQSSYARSASRSAPRRSDGCCARCASRSRRTAKTSNLASGVSPATGHAENANSCSSTPSVDSSRLPIYPASASTAKNASASSTSKIPVAACAVRPKRHNDQDLITDADGVVLPYGIYDVHRNSGTVVLGTSRETPALPSMPSSTSGEPKASSTTRRPPNYSSSPTPVAPTVPALRSSNAT